MIVFYTTEGDFIASVQDDEPGMQVTGDTEFLMQICQGRAYYQYFEAHLAKVNNEHYRSFEIHDNSIPPRDEKEARLLAEKFVMPLERVKFEFIEFPGFGSIGPLIMDNQPEIAYAYLSYQAKARGHERFELEWAMLERYYEDLKSTPGAWEDYLEEWRDDLTLGDHVVIEISGEYNPSGQTRHSLLVQLGHGLWADWPDFIDYNDLPLNQLFFVDAEEYPEEAARNFAYWINEHGGSIAAALAKDPEFDFTGSDDEDVNDLFEEYHEENVCTIDISSVDTEWVYAHLQKISEDFSRTQLLLNPDLFGTDIHYQTLGEMEERMDKLRATRRNS